MEKSGCKIKDIVSCDLTPKEHYTIPSECNKASIGFSEGDWKALLFANDEVGKLCFYGLRNVKVEKDGSLLSWSNGGKQWYVSYDKVKKGRDLKLDANELYLPFSPERCNRIKPCLRDLPLYYCSTEAQARGEVSWEEGGKQWALRKLAQLIADGGDLG
jgi:hypothetical protein